MNDVLYAIDHDLNFLQHDGRPGMKWHTHKFGKWQSQAVYAQGQPNPDAKERSGIKGAISSAKDKIVGAKARFDAKQDAAITGMIKGGKNTKGARRLEMQRTAAQLGVGLAANIAGARAIDKLVDVNKVGLFKAGMQKTNAVDKAVKAGNYKAAITEALAGGKQNVNLARNMGKFALYTAGQFKVQDLVGSAYVKTIFNGYTKRAQGTLKGVKVSDTYAKAYKDTYKEFVKKYSEKVPTLGETASYRAYAREPGSGRYPSGSNSKN